jgi:penicillin-binding protein 1B
MPIDIEANNGEAASSPSEQPAVAKTPHLTLYRTICITIALTALLSLCFCWKLTRMVDRRLAEGPFSTSTDMLAAPRTVSVGDPLRPEDLVQNLQQSGYTRTSDSPTGWFAEHAGGVEIFSGAQSIERGRVRVTFAKGEVSSIITLEDNRSLQQYQLDPPLLASLSAARERRRLVSFTDIPPSLLHAVISTEDKRFFRHGGFDVRRMLKAAYVDVKDGRKSEGASTLTMQLARSLWLDRGKSWRRKVEELLITRHLEEALTKHQIFEYYANQIYLGQQGTYSINGFGEGAQAFFGKDLSQIDTAEAALLAGVVARPSYYNPFQYAERARARRNLVLALMHTNGYLSEEERKEAAAEPVRVAPEATGDSANSYFLALANSELRAKLGDEAGHNQIVYTSLEPELQQAAEAAVHAGMLNVDQQLGKRGQHNNLPPSQPQVALIALDPHTGEVKALIGGRDYSASQLDHVLAMRQPGSVFKPFVYAAAMNTAVGGGPRVFTPASILSDEATDFYDGGQTYQPRDFHGYFMGDVTLRTALAESLNVPTVSLARQVGYGQVVAMARRAGLNDNIQPTPAVALGAYEATPLEIAGAYTMFANRGIRVRPTTVSMVRSRDGEVLYRHEPETSVVLDPRIAYLMVDMMEEVLRSGTGAGVRSRGFTLPAAGKTGTSRDGWFAGFTERLLCVVWVGFDDNRDLKLEGARSALPIWAEFMRRASQLPQYRVANSFQRPPGVVSADICTESGELAGADCPTVRQEVFVAGTEPTTQCALHSHGPAVAPTADPAN